MSKMYHYSVEISYAVWADENPKSLTDAEIKKVIDALVDYDDVPNQDNLDNMLANAKDWLREIHEFTDEEIEKAVDLQIEMDVVYRDIQDCSED